MTSVSQDRRFGVNSSMAIKVPVRAATTANVTLEGEQTIDGVSCVTDDRVLVKNQTTGADNGIYVVDSGTWSRALDFDGVYDVIHGTIVYVTSGTVSAGLFYVLTTSDPITIATTSLSFAVVSPSSTITLPLALAQGGTAASSAISGLSNLGVIQITAEAGTANAQTGTIDALVTALRPDQLFIFVPSVTNTGATTLALTPSGSGPLIAKNVRASGAALVGGELVASVPVLLHYDGVFTIIGRAPFVDSSPLVVGSSDATKKVRLEVDGLTAGQTRVLTVSDYNATIATLAGTETFTNKLIQFPATQNDSADANTLDDYEEGTWTPSVGGSATYTTQVGTYTKIGRTVHIKCEVQINSIGSGSTSQITGAPFTCASPHQFVCNFSTSATNVVFLIAQLVTTTFTLCSLTAAAANTGVSAIFKNAADVVFNGSYHV